MAQFARPNSTIAAGGWTGNVNTNDPHLDIDEVTANDDTDYATKTGSGTLEVGLSTVTDPQTGSGHTIRCRAKQQSGSGGAERLQVHLYEGATLRASSPDTQLTRGSYINISYTLSIAEADAISDYSSLRLRFVPTQGASEVVRVTWAELEVPDAATPQSGDDSGSGADSASVSVTAGAAESGSGDDSAGSAAAPRPGFRSLFGFWLGGLSRASTETPKSGSDSGSAAEATQLSAGLAAPDAGSGEESTGIAVQQQVADAAAGVDAAHLQAGLAQTEAGVGADAAGPVQAQAAAQDDAGAEESAGLGVVTAAGDSGSGADGATLVVVGDFHQAPAARTVIVAREAREFIVEVEAREFIVAREAREWTA